ncbi:cysteine-rich receptor-like protein kinase [Tanacetum coccineum]
MSGSVGSNVNARVNIVDGKPLKSILKKPKVLSHDQVAESVVYNRNFPCLGINRLNTDGKVNDVAGKPFQSVWREEPATCDESPHEVSKPANAVNTCTKFKDNLEHDVPSSDNMRCCGSSQVGNEAGTNGIEAVNFRSLLNEEKVESYDCVLPQDVADVEKVLESGPWMIRKSPIILTKWSSQLSLKKGEITCVPVWVNLHGVPVLAYSGDGLSLIATQIGKPLLLDAFTSSMCKESWGRISFARALIEVSSESELKTEVTMAIPNEKGDGYTKEVIRVEYEWKPPHCGDCKIFGHDLFQCPKHVEVNAFNDPSKVVAKPCNMEGMDTSDTTSDGFKEVKRKKNKGTNMRGADMDTMTQVDANSKANGPSTSNSFDALKDVGADCGVPSSRGSQEKEPEAGLKTSQLMEHGGSDDEVDEYIFPEGDKFGDKFDIRLKDCELKYGSTVKRSSISVMVPKPSTSPSGPSWAAMWLPQLQAGKNVMIAAHGNSLRPIIMYLDKLITSQEVISLELSTGIPMLYIVKEVKYIRRGSSATPSEASVYAYTKIESLVRIFNSDLKLYMSPKSDTDGIEPRSGYKAHGAEA